MRARSTFLRFDQPSGQLLNLLVAAAQHRPALRHHFFGLPALVMSTLVPTSLRNLPSAARNALPRDSIHLVLPSL